MRLLPLVLVVMVATGCASSYKTAEYRTDAYSAAPADDGLEFSYQYDALPGYYGSKARKRGFNVVAVRVLNTTDQAVTLGRNNLRVTYGQNPVTPVRGQVLADNVNQPVWTHLLWSLLNVAILDDNGDVELFIPSGFALAGLNIFVASSANSKADAAFVESELFGMTVPAGGSVDGLVYLNEIGSAPLGFDYVPVGSGGTN